MRNVFLRRQTSKDTSGSVRRWMATTPGWVKLAVVIMILLVLLFVILHSTGHGMGNMHMSLIETGGPFL
jgi:hypothetical protein